MEVGKSLNPIQRVFSNGNSLVNQSDSAISVNVGEMSCTFSQDEEGDARIGLLTTFLKDLVKEGTEGGTDFQRGVEYAIKRLTLLANHNMPVSEIVKDLQKMLKPE